jgi:hypothetical protein
LSSSTTNILNIFPPLLAVLEVAIYTQKGMMLGYIFSATSNLGYIIKEI